MAIPLSDNILVDAPKATDDRFGPYADNAAAIAAVPANRRYKGLFVGVDAGGANPIQLKWFESGIADGDLVDFSAGVSAGADGQIGYSNSGAFSYTNNLRYLAANNFLQLGSGTKIKFDTTDYGWTAGHSIVERGNGAIFFSENGGMSIVYNAYNDGDWKFKSNSSALKMTIGDNGGIRIQETENGNANASTNWSGGGNVIWEIGSGSTTFSPFDTANGAQVPVNFSVTGITFNPDWNNTDLSAARFEMKPDEFILGWSNTLGEERRIAIDDSGINFVFPSALNMTMPVVTTPTDQTIVWKGYADGNIAGYSTFLIQQINLGAGPGAAQDGLPLVWNNAASQFAIGSAISLTNGRGTTANGSAIDLGGAFTSNISITSSDGNQFRVTSNDNNTSAERETFLLVQDTSYEYRTFEANNNSEVSVRALMTGGDNPLHSIISTRPDGGNNDVGQLDVAHNYVLMKAQDATTSTFAQIQVNSANGIVVTDTFNQEGMRAAADYQLNYTNLSFVSKLYSDTHIQGKVTTAINALNTGAGPGAAENGYSLTWNNTLQQYVLTNITGGGSSLQLGTSGQVPYMNLSNDDYLYTDNFRYTSSSFEASNGSNGLLVNFSTSIGGINGPGNIINLQGTTLGQAKFMVNAAPASQDLNTTTDPVLAIGSTRSNGFGIQNRPVLGFYNGPTLYGVMNTDGGFTFGNVTSQGAGTINVENGLFVNNGAITTVSGTPLQDQVAVFTATTGQIAGTSNFTSNTIGVTIPSTRRYTSGTNRVYLVGSDSNDVIPAGAQFAPLLYFGNSMDAGFIPGTIGGACEAAEETGTLPMLAIAGLRKNGSTEADLQSRHILAVYNNKSRLFTFKFNGDYELTSGARIQSAFEDIRFIAGVGIQMNTSNDNFALFLNGSILQSNTATNEMDISSSGDLTIRADTGNTGQTMRFRMVSASGPDDMTITSTSVNVGQNFLPLTNNAHSIGNASLRFTEVFATNGTINTSDIRQKNIVKGKKLGLDFINKLDTISFKWKTGKDDTIHLGFSANQIQGLLNDIDKNYAMIVNGDVLGMRKDELLQPIVSAIQELSKKVDELTNK